MAHTLQPIRGRSRVLLTEGAADQIARSALDGRDVTLKNRTLSPVVERFIDAREVSKVLRKSDIKKSRDLEINRVAHEARRGQGKKSNIETKAGPRASLKR
jgi:hypothetical protein